MNQQFLEAVDAFLLEFNTGREQRYFLHLYTGSCLLCNHPADSHGVGAKLERTESGALALQETPSDAGCLVAIESGRCKCKRLFDADGESRFKVESSLELDVARWDFFLWLVAEGVYNEGLRGEIAGVNGE